MPNEEAISYPNYDGESQHEEQHKDLTDLATP